MRFHISKLFSLLPSEPIYYQLRNTPASKYTTNENQQILWFIFYFCKRVYSNDFWYLEEIHVLYQNPCQLIYDFHWTVFLIFHPCG